MKRQLVIGICWILGLGAWAASTSAHAYEMTVSVTGDPAMEEQVKEHSRLWANKDEADLPAHQLRYRLRKDQEHLKAMLGAYGFYGGAVTGRVAKGKVALMVETGPLFRFAAPQVDWLGEGERLALPDFAVHGLKKGAPALSSAVVAARGALQNTLQDEGFLAAKFTCEKLEVDHTAQKMNVRWCVDPGQRHVLAGVEVQGLTRVQPDYAKQLADQEKGKKVTPALRSQIVQNLSSAGLFDKVALRQEPAATAEKNEEQPTKLVAEVTERAHRTVSAGVRYGTSEGAGVSLGWQHRNLLGRAERLGLEATLAEQEQALEAKFTKPSFLRPDRTLRLGSAYAVEETDAYEIETIGVSGEVDQKISDRLTVSLGAALDTTLETLPTGDERFSLASVRLGAILDTRDSVLDPTHGFRLGASGAPSFGVIDTSGQFFTARLSGSVYFPVTLGVPHIVALRAVAGSIIGGSRFDIPSDRLLFAGGGGSVRGFAYQSVGPKDAQGNPAGGRALLEGSVELRSKVTEEIGLVLFADTGLVGPGRLPQTDDRLEVGAGIGVRYGTPAGPLRLDLGFPVSRRAGDDPLQIYISIGQAF